MNRTERRAICSMLVLALLAVSWTAEAADKAKKKPDSDGVKARPVATGLDNPTGIAVHPKTGDLYVATHPAVLHIVPKKDGGVHPEIVGFGTDIYGKGPKYEIGPLGVAFWGRDKLVVGDGSRPDGEELVRIYKIPTSHPHEPLKETDALYTLGPIKAGEKSARGEGNFYGVAVGAGAIFVTCNGDDTKGWVAKANIKGGAPEKLEPTIATKVATGVDAPVAITFSPEGDLVIGQMGEMTVPGDSLLTFYDPKTGELKKKFETGLSDIAGLAYHPKTGELYAVDFAWADTSQGGLFKLTVDGEKVKAEKILALDRPTALAFAKNGTLYVTVFGFGKKKTEGPRGAVLRIRGL